MSTTQYNINTHPKYRNAVHKINTVPQILSGLGGNHPGLPRIRENPTGLNYRSDIPNWIQFILLSCGMVDQLALSKLNGDNVSSTALLANPNLRFQRINLASGHRVPEEDPRVRLSHYGSGAGGAQRHWRVLAGGAASEVLAGDDDGVLGFQLAGFNEAGFIGRGKADEGVRAELLVLVGVRWDEGEVLSGDDLVRINVVVDDVAEAVK